MSGIPVCQSGKLPTLRGVFPYTDAETARGGRPDGRRITWGGARPVNGSERLPAARPPLAG
jgi:hypothetical protein